MIRPVDGGEKYDAAIVDFVGHPPSLVTNIREHMRSVRQPIRGRVGLGRFHNRPLVIS